MQRDRRDLAVIHARERGELTAWIVAVEHELSDIIDREALPRMDETMSPLLGQARQDNCR